jgi:hypothetical protein
MTLSTIHAIRHGRHGEVVGCWWAKRLTSKRRFVAMAILWYGVEMADQTFATDAEAIKWIVERHEIERGYKPARLTRVPMIGSTER